MLIHPQQNQHGAVRSHVSINGKSQPDYNGFITALCIRTFRQQNQQDNAVVTPALNYLETCQSDTLLGAYRFWPPKQQPHWCPNLPDDADDTAIMALELALASRLSQATLQQIICNVLLKNRLFKLMPPHPPWLQKGAFLTWLGTAHDRPNVVDCCVNANIVALMAFAKMQHLPGYQAACTLIESGIDWADSQQQYAKTLTPFYPDPVELTYAVHHAVQSGAKELESSLDKLLSLDWAKPQMMGNSNYQRPVCGSAYGKTAWYCEPLQVCRQGLMAILEDQAIVRKAATFARE